MLNRLLGWRCRFYRRLIRAFFQRFRRNACNSFYWWRFLSLNLRLLCLCRAGILGCLDWREWSRDAFGCLDWREWSRDAYCGHLDIRIFLLAERILLQAV